MKLKKYKPLFRGLAATTAALLTVSTVGYGIAKSELAIGWVDGFFGVDRTIYNDWEEEVPGYTIPGATEGYSYLKGKSYETTYSSADAYFEAHKANAIKQGEEGFALLKNDNSALPLNTGQRSSSLRLELLQYSQGTYRYECEQQRQNHVESRSRFDRRHYGKQYRYGGRFHGSNGQRRQLGRT